MLTLLEAYLTLILRIMMFVFGTALLGFILSIESPLFKDKTDDNTLATALRPFNIYGSIVSVFMLICSLFG